MTKSKQPIGSDLAKVDAHVIQSSEYDELPEWTPETFARADLVVDGKVVKRGRPKAAVTKVPVTLRIDPDVLAAFKATGPRWQTRMNLALAKGASRIKKGAAGEGKSEDSRPRPRRKSA